MTTTNLNLTTYNPGVDSDEGFGQYRLDLDGPTNSNMTLIDDWADVFAASVISLAVATAASMIPVDALLSSVSGSIVSSRSASPAISGSFARLDSYSGSGQADFTSISSSYTHLLIIGWASTDFSADDTADIAIDFNGDSGSSNYSSLRWQDVSGSSGSSTEAMDTFTTGQILVGKSIVTPGYTFPIFILIPNYSASSGLYKIAMGFSAGGASVSWPVTSTTLFSGIMGGTWLSTNAINRIRIFGSVGTTYKANLVDADISLYGFI